MKDRQHSLKDEGLWAEQATGDLAIFGDSGAGAREGCAAAAFLALGDGEGFAEECYV